MISYISCAKTVGGDAPGGAVLRALLEARVGSRSSFVAMKLGHMVPMSGCDRQLAAPLHISMAPT